MDLRRQDRGFLALPLRVHQLRRALLACATVVLSACGTSACGTSSKNSRPAPPGSTAALATGNNTARSASGPTSTTDPSEHDGDGDIDRLTTGRYDTDDDAIPGFGQPADAPDRRAIIALIGRYYAAAAAGEGARACSMLDTPIVESVMEEHRRGKGPASLQGDTCAQIMSKLFEQRHRELAEDITGYRVLVVQLRPNRGYALVRFPARHELRELQVLVRREHDIWLMNVPLDNGAQ
jgi:hypothetical protein